MTSKSLQLLGILILTIALSYAQQAPKITIQVPDGSKPWTSLDIQDAESRFQFAVVTDRTGGHRPGVFMDGVNKLNLLQPSFVMSVGDLIEGYTEDLIELKRQWEEFDGFVDQLQMPFFYVPGNHDYTNKVMAKVWEDRLGPSYYHFVYKDVLFLCINSERSVSAGGRTAQFNEEQLNYFKKALAENQEVKWTFAFLHKPLWTYDEESTDRWKEFENLLGEREHTVFAGHHHHYVKYEQNNGKYFMLATTGGGSRLRGPALGEFDHVVWVTVTDKGPIIANLMLEGIWDENIVPDKQWEFVGPIRNAQPLKISPVFIGEKTFDKAESMLKITNDSDAPMRAHISFSQGQMMMPGWLDWEKTIAPNSVEMVKLPLTATEPLAQKATSPLKVHGVYTYQPEGLPEVELSSQHLLKPVSLRTITSSSNINTDGNLKEWGKLSYQVTKPVIEADPFSHKGMKDASFAFDIRQDEKYVYLAAKVTDDQLHIEPTRSAWRKDGILFQIDARTAEQSANEMNSRGGIYLALSPSAEKGGETQTYFRNRIPQGTIMKAVQTPKGYEAEVAIPISVLDSIQGGSFQHLRLNVVLSDIDRNGQHSSRLSWMPIWGSKENYIGSGMFERKKSGSSPSSDTGEKK